MAAAAGAPGPMQHEELIAAARARDVATLLRAADGEGGSRGARRAAARHSVQVGRLADAALGLRDASQLFQYCRHPLRMAPCMGLRTEGCMQPRPKAPRRAAAMHPLHAHCMRRNAAHAATRNPRARTARPTKPPSPPRHSLRTQSSLIRLLPAPTRPRAPPPRAACCAARDTRPAAGPSAPRCCRSRPAAAATPRRCCRLRRCCASDLSMRSGRASPAAARRPRLR